MYEIARFWKMASILLILYVEKDRITKPATELKSVPE